MFLLLYTSIYAQRCLFTRDIWLFSSLSCDVSCLLNFGSKPLAGLLNSNVTRLGSRGLINVHLIFNKAIQISSFGS